MLAQSKTIIGTVLASDNSPLKSISVQIHGTTVGSVTNDLGKFSFETTLPAGNYTVDFSGIGFKTQALSLHLGGATNREFFIEKRSF